MGCVMEDNELLELAAKAAGFTVLWVNDKSADNVFLIIEDQSNDLSGVRWNPLRDNGEALELMVALNLDVNVGIVKTRAVSKPLESGVKITVDHFGDPCQSTRIAIVRAAAEIGKSL